MNTSATRRKPVTIRVIGLDALSKSLRLSGAAKPIGTCSHADFDPRSGVRIVRVKSMASLQVDTSELQSLFKSGLEKLIQQEHKIMQFIGTVRSIVRESSVSKTVRVTLENVNCWFAGRCFSSPDIQTIQPLDSEMWPIGAKVTLDVGKVEVYDDNS